jgi:hypothetical protein
MNRITYLNKDLLNLNKKNDIIPDLQLFIDSENRNSTIGSSISNFSIICEVGKGSYGVVYKVKSLKDNNVYAIKKIDF